MKYLSVVMTLLFTNAVFADDHGGASALGKGAFVALMVQANDPNAYVAMMRENSASFEALGSSVAGICMTKTGADYPGQMFV